MEPIVRGKSDIVDNTRDLLVRQSRPILSHVRLETQLKKNEKADFPLSELYSKNTDSMTNVFRSTRVVTPKGVAPATVVVEQERIAAIGDWGELPGAAILHDLGDLVLLPGLVDSHVHVNEPGRTEWEGF